MNSERVSAGMRAAHAEARANGHKLGFQTQVPDDVTRRIVNARRRGEAYNVIAKRLDKQRVPTPSGAKRWYPSTVERICKRQALAS